jgi:hypothetical protein
MISYDSIDITAHAYSLFRPTFLVTLLQMISDWLVQLVPFPQAAGSRTKKTESLTQHHEESGSESSECQVG